MMRQKAKPAKLCEHIKDDGKVCRSPAMRKQSCCFFHSEQRRREKRMAYARLTAKLRKDVRSETERLAERILKSPVFKNLMIKCLADGHLEDTLGIKAEAPATCDSEGVGVGNQQLEK